MIRRHQLVESGWVRKHTISFFICGKDNHLFSVPRLSIRWLGCLVYRAGITGAPPDRLIIQRQADTPSHITVIMHTDTDIAVNYITKVYHVFQVRIEHKAGP